MHVLVYESVLRDNDQLQLAHAYWVVPLPDVWWQSDANADSDSNTDSYSDANTYTDADAHSNTNPNADSAANTERAVESRWNWSIADADQPLVDG